MRRKLSTKSDSDNLAENHENAKQTAAIPAATHRLFPSLQELSFNRLIKIYGIEEVAIIIRADEEAAENAGTSQYPGARISKPLLLNKLNELVSPIVLAVVQGDLPTAEALIEQHRMLSSVKGEAIDYSRRTIREVTPLQAALCTWDDEMCEMLAGYMDPEEVVRQYNEIFPEGIKAQRASQTPFDFSELVDVISQSSEADVKAALNKEQNDTLLCQTLNHFRMDFTNRSCNEKLFNPQHLIQAFQLYSEHFARWNWDQRDLFWRQVVGFVQRFLPANIAQDVAQGIYYRVEEHEKARRSFNFRFGGGSIFPLDFDSHSGLGFDYAGVWRCRRRAWCDGLGAVARRFESYVKQKQLSCQTMQPTSQRDKVRRCIIQ